MPHLQIGILYKELQRLTQQMLALRVADLIDTLRVDYNSENAPQPVT